MKIRSSHARTREDSLLKYKATNGVTYEGCVKPDLESKRLFGTVLFINDTIHYSGKDVEEIERAFREGIEDYISTCREIDKEPEEPFKGTFNVRTSPELHAWAALEARRCGVSLNEMTNRALALLKSHSEEFRNQDLLSVLAIPGAAISVTETSKLITQVGEPALLPGFEERETFDDLQTQFSGSPASAGFTFTKRPPRLDS